MEPRAGQAPIRAGREKMQRGDIYYVDFGETAGSEQSGVRPAVVLQNNAGNRFSTTTIVGAITSQICSRTPLPVHTYIRPGVSGLARDSMAMLEQVRTADRSRIRQKLGRLDDSTMQRVDRSLAISIGLNSEYNTKGVITMREKKSEDKATAALGDYIKNKGIRLTTISDGAEISVDTLYRAFGPAQQPLKADEFFKICRFLSLDPIAMSGTTGGE